MIPARWLLLVVGGLTIGCTAPYFAGNLQLAQASRATVRSVNSASEWVPSLCRRHAELEYLNQRIIAVVPAETPGFPAWYAQHLRDGKRTWKQRCDDLRLVGDAVARAAVVLGAFADALAALDGVGSYSGDDFTSSTAALGNMTQKLTAQGSPYASGVSGAGQAFSKLADILFDIWVARKTTSLLQQAQPPLHGLIASTRQILGVVRTEELADARAQLADVADLIETRRQQRDLGTSPLVGGKPTATNDPLHVVASLQFVEAATARLDTIDRQLAALDDALAALDEAEAQLVTAWTKRGKTGAASLKTVEARTTEVQLAVQRFVFAGGAHDQD